MTYNITYNMTNEIDIFMEDPFVIAISLILSTIIICVTFVISIIAANIIMYSIFVLPCYTCCYTGEKIYQRCKKKVD